MAVDTAQETAKDAALNAAQSKADEQNKTRSGKGTRLRVGQTRGRNPQVITFEAFDESQPETLPTSIAEFATLTNTTDEKTLMEYLIDGYNSASYGNASDPISEFMESHWSDDARKQFRLVVRNYATATGGTIEQAVELIKPGFAKAQAK